MESLDGLTERCYVEVAIRQHMKSIMENHINGMIWKETKRMNVNDFIDNLIQQLEQTNAGEITQKITFNKNEKKYKFECHIEDITEDCDNV